MCNNPVHMFIFICDETLLYIYNNFVCGEILLYICTSLCEILLYIRTTLSGLNTTLSGLNDFCIYVPLCVKYTNISNVWYIYIYYMYMYMYIYIFHALLYIYIYIYIYIPYVTDVGDVEIWIGKLLGVYECTRSSGQYFCQIWSLLSG
jgi:hypothetical protein